MELEKIRTLNDAELKTEQAKAGEQLFRLRFQQSLGNQEGIKKLRGLKLEIARIQTVARERTLAAERAANPVVKNAAPAPSTRTARKKAKKDKSWQRQRTPSPRPPKPPTPRRPAATRRSVWSFRPRYRR